MLDMTLPFNKMELEECSNKAKGFSFLSYLGRTKFPETLLIKLTISTLPGKMKGNNYLLNAEQHRNVQMFKQCSSQLRMAALSKQRGHWYHLLL